MGYTTSTVHGIQVPDSSQANNIPNDLGLVVTALEGGSLVKRLTQAQINALTSPRKPAGVFFWNTTTNRLQVSDGTNVTDYAGPVYAIGTRASAQSMAGGSYTTVTYTAETDPSSMLNTGTGVITLPSAGLWLVSGYVAMEFSTGDDHHMVWLRHNSTDVAVDKSVTTGGVFDAYSSVSALVYAAASDTVQMRVFAGNTRNVRSARLSVAKIGA